MVSEADTGGDEGGCIPPTSQIAKKKLSPMEQPNRPVTLKKIIHFTVFLLTKPMNYTDTFYFVRNELKLTYGNLASLKKTPQIFFRFAEGKKRGGPHPPTNNSCIRPCMVLIYS
jgi:hypothetical protein